MRKNIIIVFMMFFIVSLIFWFYNYATKFALASQIMPQSIYKKYRWGLKKVENGFPVFDSKANELLIKNNGLCIGDTTKNKIYLTFDEGYENGYTSQILDILKKNNIKAVFFITGPYLEKQTNLISRMMAEGHAIGNHTVNHPSLAELKSDEKIVNEVKELDEMFYERFRQNMKFLRPPKGEFSEQSLKLTSDLGYINMLWSLAYDDWDINKQHGTEYALKKTVPYLHNGCIVLLHACSKDNSNALNEFISQAQKRGYEFGDPKELIK